MGNFIIPTDEQTYLSEGSATNEVILGGIPKRAVDCAGVASSQLTYIWKARLTYGQVSRQHTENLKVFQTWPCFLARKMGSTTHDLIYLEQKKTATKVVGPGFKTLASLVTGYQGYEDKMANGLAITSWWIPLGRSQQ